MFFSVKESRVLLVSEYLQGKPLPKPLFLTNLKGSGCDMFETPDPDGTWISVIRFIRQENRQALTC